MENMRFMVIVKANKESEAGVLPTQEIISKMMTFNEELVKAGVMLLGEGLQPSSKGFRIKFAGTHRIVTEGPFAETKELIAGYWIWQTASREEALEWAKRAPMEEGQELEVRKIYEASDFGDALTPELQAQEEQLRAEIASRK